MSRFKCSRCDAIGAAGPDARCECDETEDHLRSENARLTRELSEARANSLITFDECIVMTKTQYEADCDQAAHQTQNETAERIAAWLDEKSDCVYEPERNSPDGGRYINGDLRKAAADIRAGAWRAK